MSRILIAGCGDVGTALGRRLADAGHEVLGLRRSAVELPAGIRNIRADLADPASLGGLPADIDSVVYLAAADAREDGAYERAYVRGPGNLIAALVATDRSLRRLVFVSSTGVYAQSAGEWVDEDSPAEPEQFSGKRLLEGERLVRAAPIPAVVVRFAGIYGPGRNRLQQRVIAGTPCQETPPVYTNRIHRDDCAAVLEHVLMLEQPEEIYVGVDCEPAAECAVMDWLATRLGVRPPPRARPTHDTGIQRGRNKRCRNARLLASGYRFIYPSYREGYSSILADCTAAG